jgi:cyclopropane fatty-acyl-phospholipid synthase-like methyltransferase
MIGLGKFQDLSVDTTISPRDGMFTPGQMNHYKSVGQSALHAIDHAMRRTGTRQEDVRHILDLPSGHGRVLRFLRAAFPDARITACDIVEDGIEFCAKQFGALPVISDVDVDAIQLPGHYDLIWVGSLFTHIPADQWHSFLSLFEKSLEPGGLLLFTTAGRTTAQRISEGQLAGLDPSRAKVLLHDYESQGFGWVPTDFLGEHWGRSLAMPSWVLAQVVSHASLELIYFQSQFWANRQDVTCCRALQSAK